MMVCIVLSVFVCCCISATRLWVWKGDGAMCSSAALARIVHLWHFLVLVYIVCRINTLGVAAAIFECVMVHVDDVLKNDSSGL